MNKEEYQKIIKDEGDEYEFEAFGLPCLMMRNRSFGNWCGYVGVPKDSRLNGKNYYFYTESENGLSKLEQAINNISVHGGLTFSEKRKENDDTWYFGFDCAHSGDLVGYLFDYPEMDRGDTYKDKQFVITECQNLAKQLKDIIDLKL